MRVYHFTTCAGVLGRTRTYEAPLGTAGLQPAAIAAMRPTLETRVGFEPTIIGLQPIAFVHLATASGRGGGNRTRSSGFGGQVVAMTLTPWLQGKDSNLRDLLQRQTAYH